MTSFCDQAKWRHHPFIQELKSMALEAMEPRSTAGIDSMLKIVLQKILRPEAPRSKFARKAPDGVVHPKVGTSPVLR